MSPIVPPVAACVDCSDFPIVSRILDSIIIIITVIKPAKINSYTIHLSYLKKKKKSFHCVIVSKERGSIFPNCTRSSVRLVCWPVDQCDTQNDVNLGCCCRNEAVNQKRLQPMMWFPALVRSSAGGHDGLSEDWNHSPPAARVNHGAIIAHSNVSDRVCLKSCCHICMKMISDTNKQGLPLS